MKDARTWWAWIDRALLGILILVGASGLPLWLNYRPDPARLPAMFDSWDTGLHYARALHLWSSRALLFLGVLHTARVWHQNRVAGKHRPAYVWGATMFLLLGLAHATGHLLRWDAMGQTVALFLLAFLAPVGGAQRWLLLPDRSDASLLSAITTLHVGLFTILILATTALHLALVKRGTLVDPAFARQRVPFWAAALAGAGTVAFIALVLGAPTAQRGLPWPLGAFELPVLLTNRGGSLGLLALVSAAVLLLQPWLLRWRPVVVGSRYVLAGLFAVSLLRALA